MIAYAYDHTGNVRVPIEIRPGDEVNWKRNGQVGASRGRIMGWTLNERVRIYLIDTERHVTVKPRFLAIYRDGKRLP